MHFKTRLCSKTVTWISIEKKNTIPKFGRKKTFFLAVCYDIFKSESARFTYSLLVSISTWKFFCKILCWLLSFIKSRLWQWVVFHSHLSKTSLDRTCFQQQKVYVTANIANKHISQFLLLFFCNWHRSPFLCIFGQLVPKRILPIVTLAHSLHASLLQTEILWS